MRTDAASFTKDFLMRTGRVDEKWDSCLIFADDTLRQTPRETSEFRCRREVCLCRPR
jgi:hypothetical protein